MQNCFKVSCCKNDQTRLDCIVCVVSSKWNMQIEAMQTRLVAVAVSKELAGGGGENKPIEDVDEYVLYTFGWPETLIVLE